MVVRDSQRIGTPWSEIVQIKQNVPHSFSQVPLTKHPSQALLNWSTTGSQLSNTPPTLAVTPAAEGGEGGPPSLLRHTSSALLGGGAAPTKPVFEYGNLLPSCSGLLAPPSGAAPAEQPLVEWSLNTYKSRFDNDFGADASAGVLINSVRMVVVWRLVCELLEYVPAIN